MENKPIELSAQSPAKINLFLHVTGRREDGYHLLESIFCPITLSDDVAVTATRRDDGALTISRTGDLTHIPEEKDLTIKAVRAFHAVMPLAGWHLAIHVKKRIPEQAGMGGGSSNAATVLSLLQQLINHQVPEQALRAIGLQLGADVPFFLQPYSAFVSGIGEKIHPIKVPRAYLLLYKPPESCPTGEIFQSKQLTRNSSPVKMSVFDSSTTSGSEEAWWKWLSANTGNSLQKVVEQMQPSWLERFNQFAAVAKKHSALVVRMTGSGSAMFAAFSCRSGAEACQVSSSHLEGQLFTSRIESPGM